MRLCILAIPLMVAMITLLPYIGVRGYPHFTSYDTASAETLIPTNIMELQRRAPTPLFVKFFTNVGKKLIDKLSRKKNKTPPPAANGANTATSRGAPPPATNGAPGGTPPATARDTPGGIPPPTTGGTPPATNVAPGGTPPPPKRGSTGTAVVAGLTGVGVGTMLPSMLGSNNESEEQPGQAVPGNDPGLPATGSAPYVPQQGDTSQTPPQANPAQLVPQNYVNQNSGTPPGATAIVPVTG
ncbi:hypothetical protein IWQ61_006529 [Dispira simplex]|nr:hypothetical protein IWQ61_006529 [Dispira simplex]